MAKNEIATIDDVFTNGTIVIPNQTTEDLKEVASLSKGAKYLGRIQLYSAKTDAVAEGIIPVGHYGIPASKTEIQDLGPTIDVMVIARRAKALDMSDKSAVVANYDVKSEIFQSIQQRADDRSLKNSNCIYGPTYLIYERSTSEFYEYFCSSASARISSGNFNVFLPVTQAMIDGGFTKETAPRGPKAMTMEVEFIKKPTWSNHLPKVSECVTKFKTLPKQEDLIKQITRFFKDEEEVETQEVEAKTGGRKT